jgi:hypothetical protein
VRIVRYTLEIVDYQQLQPLWPGRILSVGPCPPFDDDQHEIPFNDPRRYRVDMWCLDNDAVRDPETQPAPILGVWIIGTGRPMPTSDPHFAEAMFHGTVDHRPHGGAWHVFTAVVGAAEVGRRQPEAYSSVDDMAERIRAEHAAKRGRR